MYWFAAGDVDVDLIMTIIFFLIIIAVSVIKVIVGAVRQGRTQSSAEPASEFEERKEPDRAGAGQIQDFLDELARQSGAPTAERRPRPQQPRPAPAPRPRQPRPVQPSQAAAGPVPLARPVERPERPRPRPRREPRKPAVQVPRPKEIVPSRPEPEPVAAVAAIEEVEEKIATPAERLDALLPKDPFQRAIALREVLGPCRATRPFRLRAW